jgi:hypothetical protein
MTDRLTSIHSTVAVSAAALAAVIVATSSGCAVPSSQETTNPAPAREDIGESSSPLVVGSWTDWSGTIHITMYACGPSPASTGINQAGCAVPDDRMVVGGGVQVTCGPGNQPCGGDAAVVLQGSYPLDDLRTWWANSFTMNGTSHEVTVYALGLELDGVSGSQLRQMAILKKNTSAGSVQHPEVVVYTDPEYVMVGAGALASGGQNLVASAPGHTLALDQWRAKSKEHGGFSPGWVRAYAIEIPIQPAGFWTDIHNTIAWSQAATVTSGNAAVSTQTVSNWALSSVGGVTTYSGAGRMLQELHPIPIAQGTAKVESTDVFWASGGDLFAVALALSP